MGDLYEPGSFDGWETNGDRTLIHRRGHPAKCPNCGSMVNSGQAHDCTGLPVGAVGDHVLYRLTSQDVMHFGDEAQRASKRLHIVAGDCAAGVVVAQNSDSTCNLLLFLNGTLGPRLVTHKPIGDRPGEFRVRA